MTEIERIINDSNKDKPVCCHIAVNPKWLAKAIEQYVIKARIEELEKYVVRNINADIEPICINCAYWNGHDVAVERIAQLKKGIK